MAATFAKYTKINLQMTSNSNLSTNSSFIFEQQPEAYVEFQCKGMEQNNIFLCIKEMSRFDSSFIEQPLLFLSIRMK